MELPKGIGALPEIKVELVVKEAAPVIEALSLPQLIKDYEYLLLHQALTKTSGNLSWAAKLLRIGRGNLYNRMKKYLLNAKDFKGE